MAKQGKCHRNYERLSYEILESRVMLTGTQADIVFLVDESLSATTGVFPNEQPIKHVWLEGLIERLEESTFADSLTSKGIDDIQYGLVGFGDDSPFAHSQVVDAGETMYANTLWGDLADMTGSSGAISNLENGRGSNPGVADVEDGWDAIEHAIMEYRFRDGSVPIFVLVQDEEGRFTQNRTVTHTGLLKSLESKNIILNSLVAGQNQLLDALGDEPDPLFDLSVYDDPSNPNDNFSSDIRILGVEADETDAIFDGQHDFHWLDTNVENTVVDVPTETTSEALQISYNGSNTGPNAMVGSRKSIEFSQGITGDIGPTAAGYSARSIPFAPVDMSSGTTEQFNLSTSLPPAATRVRLADSDVPSSWPPRKII